MIRNYFLVAWRNMIRNKAFSFTNLSGLIIGMTATIMILLWVQNEWKWDRFHRNHADIYQVMANRNFNGSITTDNAVPFPLANALKNEFPEIKNVVTDDYGQDRVISYNEVLLKKRILTVSPGYFNLFHWTFISGNPSTSLQGSQEIILSQSTAKALFGEKNPIDRMVRIDNHALAKVTAVVQDPPQGSTIQFNAITLFDYSSDQVKKAQSDWQNCYTEAFLEVQKGTDINNLSQKISDFFKKRSPDRVNGSMLLFPMDKWHLYSEFKEGKNAGGMIAYVKLFAIIAVVILVIACVNFMNLSTAKSEKRAKEIGIRKTLGSKRKQLLFQFYAESALYATMAFIGSVLLVYLVCPLFNKMINSQLSFNLTQPFFLLAGLCIILFTALLAGSYPALYLSSFNPVKVLKGVFLPGKLAVYPRKVLVVIQFIISIFLISSTILVSRQMEFVKNRDLGYNPNNLISIPFPSRDSKNATVIKNELMKTDMIASVTRTSSPITEIWNFSPAPDWEGKPAGSNLIMSNMASDENFTKTLATPLIAGNDFTDLPADSSAVILNKAAVSIMQLKDPVGKKVRYANRDLFIKGVTENIVMSSPYKAVMPMMVFHDGGNTNFMVLRLKSGVSPHTVLPVIERIFKLYNSGFPFEYSFADEQFSRKFITEDIIARLTNIFAGLAIFISCLGLFGLTAFTIEKRIKEIGIRKILGASTQQLLFLISKEFLILVLLAIVISMPLTWWLLNNWLQEYEYRTHISMWIFVISAICVLLLTLLTVSLNSFKAAIKSPVKNLRTE